jgi:hypothetical protein
MKTTTILSLKTPKPRNPLVAPAHFRRAGSHQPGGGSMRRDGRRALRRELDQLQHQAHSP